MDKVEQLEQRIKVLEKEVAELRRLLRAKNQSPLNNWGAPPSPSMVPGAGGGALG